MVKSIKNKIVFLCESKEDVRERAGLSEAFRYLGYEVIFLGKNEIVEEYLTENRDEIFCILNPEPYNPIHPNCLWKYDIPNITFQWDTFTIPKKRLFAARPYDMQVICHPKFKQLYTRYGCKHVFIFPWCIDSLLLEKSVSKIEGNRAIDIGWVGRSDAKFYENRRLVLRLLKLQDFKINDTEVFYTWEQMFLIFSKSKLVVNVSRDDFPEDANMRCFEAMGCGALLMTKMPSELVSMGFKEGVHFVGYRDQIDLLKKINYFLRYDNLRKAITDKSSELVLKEHTYLQRAKAIVNYVSTNYHNILVQNKFRTLSVEDRYYFLAFSYLKDNNFHELLNCFKKTSFFKKIRLSPLVFKLCLRKYKSKLMSIFCLLGIVILKNYCISVVNFVRIFTFE